MVAFHASRVDWSDDPGCTVVTLDEGGEGAEYLTFQRAHEEHPTDTGVYVERRGQAWAARGGILCCDLHRNSLLLRVEEGTAGQLGGESEFEVTFELPFQRFRSLRSRLRKVFHGVACFADRSAGERLVRRPPNELAEALEQLIGNWFGLPGPGDACSHDLIRSSEKHQGFRIPEPLRDYYLRFGESKVLRHSRGMLLTPEALETEDDHLVFWMEHKDDQEGAGCGVHVNALALPDPPVERQIFLSEDETAWVPECRRLSWFLLRTLCWQAVWGLASRAAAPVTPAAREKIASRLTLVAPGEPLAQETVAYTAEGLAACVLPGEGILRVGARGDDRLRWLEQELGVALQRI
jgi:hypothetical protein